MAEWANSTLKWAKDHSGCPALHVSMLGARMGAEWKMALQTITPKLGTGCLFLLIGPRGTGKTQMAVELIHDEISRYVTEFVNQPDNAYKPFSHQPARYHDALDFFIDVKSTYRKDSAQSERDIVNSFIDPELLVFDEISARGETKWEDDLFFSMVNKRYAARKDTILIGNLKNDEVIACVGASIASRLVESGGIINCAWHSFRKSKS